MDNKIIARLPKGWIDRRGSDLVKKKKIISIIENNFIKFGFTGLETPFAEISENIGSFIADDPENPMADVYTFEDSTGATHQSTDSVWMRSGLSVGDMVFCSATATDPDGLSVEAHFIPYTLPQNDAYFLP